MTKFATYMYLNMSPSHLRKFMNFSQVMNLVIYTIPLRKKSWIDFLSNGLSMLPTLFLVSPLPLGLKIRSIKETLNWQLTRISWLRWTLKFFKHSMVRLKLAVSVTLYCYVYQSFSHFYLMLSYEGNRSQSL